MAEVHLSQVEADALLAMEKHAADEREYDYDGLQGASVIPLNAADGRETFHLDICRGRVNLLKGTYQNRARQVVILARLDFGGAPHRNPDGEEIPSPHLHLYREGFGDKWAVSPPAASFGDVTDSWLALHDFMKLCNITRPPRLSRGLFV